MRRIAVFYDDWMTEEIEWYLYDLNEEEFAWISEYINQGTIPIELETTLRQVMNEYYPILSQEEGGLTTSSKGARKMLIGAYLLFECKYKERVKREPNSGIDIKVSYSDQ